MKQLNVMVIGAHPDDCEGGCGGIALKYIKEGSKVTFVSVTDGSAGHQTMDRKTLANVRREEAERSAAVSGVKSIVLDHPDGLLENTGQFLSGDGSGCVPGCPGARLSACHIFYL